VHIMGFNEIVIPVWKHDKKRIQNLGVRFQIPIIKKFKDA